jgi:hypothetical protein
MSEGDRAQVATGAQSFQPPGLDLLDHRSVIGAASRTQGLQRTLVLGPAEPDGGVRHGDSFGHLPLPGRRFEGLPEQSHGGQRIDLGPVDAGRIGFTGTLGDGREHRLGFQG